MQKFHKADKSIVQILKVFMQFQNTFLKKYLLSRRPPCKGTSVIALSKITFQHAS